MLLPLTGPRVRGILRTLHLEPLKHSSPLRPHWMHTHPPFYPVQYSAYTTLVMLHLLSICCSIHTTSLQYISIQHLHAVRSFQHRIPSPRTPYLHILYSSSSYIIQSSTVQRRLQAVSSHPTSHIRMPKNIPTNYDIIRRATTKTYQILIYKLHTYRVPLHTLRARFINRRVTSSTT